MVEINEDVKIYFPLKYKPRKIQFDLLYETIKSVSSGKKYTLLNAPTGLGKSYYAVMFMNWYRNIVNENATFDIVTNSKILQDQYKREFDFIHVLKGKTNYYCDKFDTDCENGLQLCTSLNQRCNNCPYKQAKELYKESTVSSSNFHLFDSLHLFTSIREDRKSNVLIIDEAHDFEAVYSEYISMAISARMLKKYGFEESKIRQYDIFLTNIYQKIKSKRYKTKDFITWLNEEFKPTLNSLHTDLTNQLSTGLPRQTLNNISSWISSIEGKLASIRKISDTFEEDENNWVLEISRNEKEKSYSGYKIELKPIWVHDMLSHIWEEYDHIVFMSGTILNREMFSYINGLDPNLSSYYSCESPFEIKKRPIYYLKLGKMTYANKKQTFKKQKEYINKIIDKHENNKGIIHTFNYELSGWIQKEIFNKRFLFHDVKDREEKLNKHLNSKLSTILVSPSMQTGIDLKDDLSRFQIILKIPYPNISSEKIKARQRTNKEWYNWKTVSDLIQAYGRSIRSEDDYAETYILDESFTNIMIHNSKYLPRWFTDAIKTLKV